MHKALDIANYAGYLSAETVQAWRNAGIEKVIVSCEVKDITKQQLSVLVTEGMQIEVYQFLYWDSDMRSLIDFAFHAFEGYSPAKIWLDVEESTSRTHGTVIDLIQQAFDVVGDRLPAGIYTSKGKWNELTGNTDRFSDKPLWDCTDYGAEGNHFTPYGGWDHSEIEQYILDTTLAGVGVDLDESFS